VHSQSNHPSSSSQNQIKRSAFAMGIATLFSRIAGLLREQVFAYLFGAQNVADAFNIAFRIPNLLRDLFAEGAMSSAFVPNFTKALLNNKTTAFKLYAGCFSALLIITGSITILGFIFAEELVKLYASGFILGSEKFNLTVDLTKTMFPFFPMIALAALSMGALNALGFFFLPAFAPTMFNLGSILCGLSLTPIFIKTNFLPPIYSMAIGVLMGGFFQFAIQIYKLYQLGFRFLDYKKSIFTPFAQSEVRAVLKLLIPGTIGLAATQLNILVNTIFATSLGTGVVSWLNYAFRLMQLPIGLFGVSTAQATLPVVSKKIAQNNLDEAGSELRLSLEFNFLINTLVATFLILVSFEVIQILFEHGNFLLNDTKATSTALIFYAFGLPFYSMVKIIAPVFYALNRAYIPVIASFFSVIVNFISNFIFLKILQLPFWSLALATSCTAFLNSFILLIFIHKYLKNAVNKNLNFYFFKILMINFSLGFIVYFLQKKLFFLLVNFNKYLQSVLSILFAFFLFSLLLLLVNKIFGLKELDQVFLFFKKKIFQRRRNLS
jgi:putative peptidoglycan lipid II flippase